jgi:hypothetical protein
LESPFLKNLVPLSKNSSIRSINILKLGEGGQENDRTCCPQVLARERIIHRVRREFYLGLAARKMNESPSAGNDFYSWGMVWFRKERRNKRGEMEDW